MEKMSRQKILSLPNGVTIIRIAAIPIILFLLFTSGQTYQIFTASFFYWLPGRIRWMDIWPGAVEW